MAKKRYPAEQIINHLREAEIIISKGKTIREASRQLGITEQTYYRWRKGNRQYETPSALNCRRRFVLIDLPAFSVDINAFKL